MAIAYKSQGAGVATEASGASLAPACPATVDAGDVLIAHIGFEGTSDSPSTPSGWTLLGGSPYTIESAHRHWIFGKIADGTEDGATVDFGSNAITTVRTARIYSFSGRVAGSITALVTGFAHLSHATDPQMPTVTTTLAGALAVACIWQADDNPQANATGETGGDWVEAVAEYVQSATTPDTGMGIQTCTPTGDPGTVTGGSVSTLNDPCGVIGFEIKTTDAQTVSPSAIAGGEAFGTAKVNQQISGAGNTASAEAFGAAKVNLTVSGAGNIGTAEVFGTAELTQAAGGQTVSPSAIGSAETFGTPQVNLTVFPEAIASDEAFGNTTLGLTISGAGAIASAETFGSPSLNFTVSPSSINSEEAFGDPSIGLTISPSAIASTETFGSPSVHLTVYPAAIASAEAFGTPTLASGNISDAGGIPSAEAFGTPRINLEIRPTGIASSESFGNPSVRFMLRPTAIASGEVLGTPTVSIGADKTVSPVGIPSSGAFGIPFLGAYYERILGGSSYAGLYPLAQAKLDPTVVTFGKTGRWTPRRRLTLRQGLPERILVEVRSGGAPLSLAGASAVLTMLTEPHAPRRLVELAARQGGAGGRFSARVTIESLAPGIYEADLEVTLPSGDVLRAPGRKPLELVVV
ncbi:MAG: hypothetical protein ACRD1X_14585 [Vicinamibacteria bacterium]